MRILLVEDDEQLATLITDYLEKYGFSVKVPTDFHEILAIFKAVKPELILLDVNLPVFDGFYWCQQLRKQTTCPIIFISARDGSMDQVMALTYGGDDYLTKSFDLEVLLAKVNSHIRRVYGEYALNMPSERVIEANDLKFYPERLQMTFDDTVDLSKKEGELLRLLIENYPQIVSRELILNKLWDDENFVDDNTLSVNVGRLRKKLADIGVVDGVLTVRGLGYRLQLPEKAGK